MQIILDLVNNSDFAILWQIGEQILAGNGPYATGNSWYPPGASYLFVLFALLPFHVSYVTWLIINMGIFYKISQRFGTRWLLFFPVVFVFIAGQVDLIFVALVPFLKEKEWKAPVAAAIITLKPISAIVILPWFLVRWLLYDRKTFIRFVKYAIIIQAWPLLVRPQVVIEWIGTILGTGTGHYLGGFGIWLFDSLSFPILAASSLLIICFGLITDTAHRSRIYLSLANPYAMFYHAVYLVSDVPTSTILAANLGFLLALINRSPLFLMLIPIAFLHSESFSKLEKKLSIPSSRARTTI